MNKHRSVINPLGPVYTVLFGFPFLLIRKYVPTLAASLYCRAAFSKWLHLATRTWLVKRALCVNMVTRDGRYWKRERGHQCKPLLFNHSSSRGVTGQWGRFHTAASVTATDQRPRTRIIYLGQVMLCGFSNVKEK